MVGNNSTVKGKLIFVVMCVIIGLIISTTVSFFSLSNVFNRTNYANVMSIPSIKIMSQIGIDFGVLRVRTHRHVLTFTPSEMKETETLIQAKINDINKSFDEYQKFIDDESDKKFTLEEKQLFQNYVNELPKLLELSRQNKTEESAQILTKILTPIAKSIENHIQKHIDLNIEFAKKEATLAEEAKSNAVLILITVSLVILIIVIILSLNLIKNLYSQLGGEPIYAVDITKEIAQGNLTLPINTQQHDNSSILIALKKMQDILKNTVRNVLQSASTLNQSISNLNQTTHQIKQATENQSEASSAVASTIEELTVSIESIHHSSSKTLDLSKQSKDLSLKSKNVINSVATEVQSVAQIVSTSVELTKNLGQRSQEINAIVGIISDVAEQTNLLALNAAIEAARAGESGKGFAVVADEVRKLAERTSQSTEQIRQVINAIRNDIDKVVDNMNQSEENVHASVEFAKQASDAIDHIVESSNQITDLIQEISSSLSEQSTASQDIAHHVERIAQMSEENTKAVSNTADIAERINRQAGTLMQLIKHFKV